MDILLVRHAIAEERDRRKWPDDRGRPLTRLGMRKFRSVASVLSRVWQSPDVVLSSSFARAWQTAQILEKACGWPAPVEFSGLEPGRRPTEILSALKRSISAERLVLVGHEPSMHDILSLFLSGTARSVSMEMKKGGAALVRFDAEAKAGAGSLVWLLPPQVLIAAAKD